MQKRLVFPVDVGDKVLRALGQVQDGLQVDDLRTGGLDRRGTAYPKGAGNEAVLG